MRPGEWKGSRADASLTPTRLRCEHRLNPSGVDVPRPRLSWALEAEARCKRQTAFRILVSDNEKDLSENRGNLWDSGKVLSDRTVGVVYSGEELHSGTRCFWKVRSWDERDTPSSYSEPAYWTMGLLRNSDWKGVWIQYAPSDEPETSPPEDGSIDPLLLGLVACPHLRKEFTLRQQPVRRAQLCATARGVYELFVNGERVGRDVLAPGWTDYNSRIQYQTYDVTDLLMEGRNAVGAVLSDGWFSGFYGMDPKRSGAHYGARPQLLVHLDVEYEDGTSESVVSDDSWKSFTGPLLYSDLLMGESYDARLEMPGWTTPGFDDKKWTRVRTESLDKSTRLVAQPDEGARVMQELETKEVTQPGAGIYVFDMGQNMVGWVRLTVRGEAGTKITLRYAEMLDPTGNVYTENLRSARATDSYVLKGEGEEVYEPRFTFHGFRYVEVSGYPGTPPPSALVGRVVHSDTSPSGKFECSNPLVNKLQENILWGQRGNFLSVPTDCPQRDERLGWLGDAQVFVRTAALNMDVAAFFTKWMDDVEDAQSPEGAFPDVAPSLDLSIIDWVEGAPAWGDAGIIVPWTIYQSYGDTRILEKHYGAMSRWMEHLHGMNPDLLRKNGLGNNYGDWLSPDGDATPCDLLATAYWAYDAKLMAEVAETLGHHADARRYGELFESIRVAFNEAYVAPDGRLKGDTQTCYVLALHMGLVTEEGRSIAARHLVRTIREKDWHLSTGFVGVGYLCPVLTEVGHADVAYQLLMNETYPSWGYTIRHGATTIWERWDGWTEEGGFQSPNMNSFNHYSLGSVGEWLYRYVAGIDIGAPGYERILIRPHPGGDLTWAVAEYDSVRGRILCDWENSEGVFRLRVSIPANTTAAVRVPDAGRAEVKEGNRPAEEAEGVRFLRLEGGAAVYEVGSGRYEFSTGSTR